VLASPLCVSVCVTSPLLDQLEGYPRQTPRGSVIVVVIVGVVVVKHLRESHNTPTTLLYSHLGTYTRHMEGGTSDQCACLCRQRTLSLLFDFSDFPGFFLFRNALRPGFRVSADRCYDVVCRGFQTFQCHHYDSSSCVKNAPKMYPKNCWLYYYLIIVYVSTRKYVDGAATS